MGYYVDIVECDIFISKDNLSKAWQALVELNKNPKYDKLKNGGSSQIELPDGQIVSSNTPRPNGYDYHPAKWFSWLPADYHRRFNGFVELMKDYGLEPYLNDGGDIIGFSYQNKIGNEDILFSAIAPFIRNNSYIEWHGEDNIQWRWVFVDGKMYVANPKVTWKINFNEDYSPDKFLDFAD